MGEVSQLRKSKDDNQALFGWWRTWLKCKAIIKKKKDLVIISVAIVKV